MTAQRRILIVMVAAIVAAGFLGFTKPGKRVLSSLGFAAACGTSDGC